MSTAKNAILKTKIEGVIYEVLVKTNAANVYVDDNTTLAAKLTSILADIATKASTEEMNAALAQKAEKVHTHEQSDVNGLVDLLATLATSQSVTDAIDALRQEMLGDTPVEAYNTFTEMAQYIEEHQEAADALTAAVGNKADKATTLAGYGIADAYTKTEVDTKISDAVKSATGGESAASVKASLEAYQTSNDARVKAIEDDYLKGADKTELAEDITNGDATTLSQAKTYAKEYADGLAGNYDAKGSAATAEQNAKDYADGLAGNYDAKGSAATAEQNAKDYADGLAGNYDAKGAAATAEQNAKTYADGLNTAMDTRVKAVEGKAHEHANKTVLDGISEANVNVWNAKANIFYSETEPANLAAGDLWVQLV